MRVFGIAAAMALLVVSTLSADRLNSPATALNLTPVQESNHVSAVDSTQHHTLNVCTHCNQPATHNCLSGNCQGGHVAGNCATGSCGAVRTDHCGSTAGFPGRCGRQGPGCCGNLWDNYCNDRKPCFSSRSPRRHVGLPSLAIPVGFGCLICGDRPLQKPCFTQAVALPSLNLGRLRCRAGCDTNCDTGCDARCDSNASPVMSSPVSPSQPVPAHVPVDGPAVSPQETEAMPPPNPSARRGIFPFSLKRRAHSEASPYSARKGNFLPF